MEYTMGYCCVGALSSKKNRDDEGRVTNSPAVAALGRSAAVSAQGQRESVRQNSSSLRSESFPGNERVVDLAMAPAASWSLSDGNQNCWCKTSRVTRTAS